MKLFLLFLVFNIAGTYSNAQTEEVKKKVTQSDDDSDACFPGGAAEMQRFIYETLIYPEEAIELGIQGRVYLSFIIEVDGSISTIQIMRGLSPETNKEAIRIINSMPKWIPSQKDGELVRTRCSLPINFVFKAAQKKAKRKLRKKRSSNDNRKL
ncbi:MAG: energy transducer TonB [Crocinitomicaceae bacterium]|nr:energy transducer TonB [Crocinitomicaceae bacterium]